MDFSSDGNKQIPPCEFKDYLDSLTRRVKYWKLVRAAPSDDWSGDFIIQGVRYFLLLGNAYHKANLRRWGWKSHESRFLYCCGTDDWEFAIRQLSAERAREIYDTIGDYASIQSLRKLGFIFQG